MKMDRNPLAAGCITAATLACNPAISASLRPDKATDASVCDLAPNTNAILARRILIPAEASSKDQTEAYFRLGANFVVNRCADGQLLILHGESADDVDVASLSMLAGSACHLAAIARTEVPYTYSGRSRPGFELRCSISKHSGLSAVLADHERADPAEALAARMSSGFGDVAPKGQTAKEKTECSQVSLATLLRGGVCP